MNVHEYQAKRLLAAYGAPTPRGGLATTPSEARAVAKELGAGRMVVKAQTHAGGRGKGGGVKVVETPDQAVRAAKDMLGMTLVTHQTGPEGRLVRKVWVEETADIDRELYLAVVVDRARECLTVMASPDGGMDIEEVAAKTPERIITTRIIPGHDLWG